jgi:Glycosyltransferase family 87
MSVKTPLGATQSGAFGLRSRILEADRARSQSLLGMLGLAGVVVTGVLVAISAGETGNLEPQTVRLGGVGAVHLQGTFGTTGINLGGVGLTAVIAVMFVSYVLAVRKAGQLSPRLVLGAIAALTALMLLAPPLVSTDVFSYQFYGRIGAMYHGNPYVASPYALHLDPLYSYIGSKWVSTATVYGPVFTALSYPLARLSIPTDVFVYKAIAAVSSLAVVALVWNGARRRGVDQVKAAALVGLNPLIVVYGVGGGHNDLLMLVPLMAGLVLLIQRRGRLGASSIVLGAGIKMTAGLLLPFALAGARGPLLSTRRRDILIGAGVATAALAIFTAALFGTGPLHLPATIEHVQSIGNWQSVPGFIGTRLGLGTVGHPVALMLGVLFAVVVAWLLRRVWQGELDWIAGAGWAAFALLVTAASLLPWYVAWLMPLAALGRDRLLWKASLALTGVMVGFQLLAYIPHGSTVGL